MKKLMILDEFSLLNQTALHYIRECQKEIMGNTESFGGITMVLEGDRAQLSPVSGNSVWNTQTSISGGGGSRQRKRLWRI